jgi:hypothetical protein
MKQLENITQKQLNEFIHLFLNDIDDYSDDVRYNMLCEATLNKFKVLITESDNNIHSRLLTESQKDTEQGDVFKDFLFYIDSLA